ALRVRVPAWSNGGGAALNGRALEGFAAPGGWFVVDRVWKDGDRLDVSLPMALHVQPMPDDPTVQAVMYGPLVLVGRLGTDGITDANRRAEPTKPRTVPEFTYQPPAAPSLRARGDDAAAWIQRVSAPDQPLAFRTSGQEHDVDLVPFYTLYDERYAVYWKMNG
ncbi:MAG TPA: DUF4986 domain-containing protein, partial [Gemmatimonadales bacterium]|nr:DUF4986 domain-containing protein [Gemmatimonadales bacterium]